MTANLPKPWKYKDWLIWPNTAIDNMNYNRVGCADTIDGVCYNDISIKECIEKSVDGTGYHVEFKNGNSLCVPLRTSPYTNLNIVYKLRNQSVHPELNNVSVSTFVDTNKYKFPPLVSDIFFYFDIFQLRNDETKLILSSKDVNTGYNEFLSKGQNNLNIQIIPTNAFAPQIVNYEKVLYGDNFNIILAGTSLFLTFDSISNTFIWKQTTIRETNNFFQIIPLDLQGKYHKNKMNTPIGNTDSFTIVYSNDIILTLTKDNILGGNYDSIDRLIERGDLNVKNSFGIISKMTGYYCKNDKCTPVPLSEVSEKEGETLYDNSTVGRNKDCWGACKYWDENTNTIPEYSIKQPSFKFQIKDNRNIYILFGITAMLILVIILALYFTRNSIS